MAIQHAENFSAYGTNKGFMLENVYASIGGTAGGVGTDGVSLVTDPQVGGTDVVLRFDADSYGGANNASHIRLVLDTTGDVIGMAARFFLARLPNNTSEIPTPFQFCNAGNSPIASVYITTTGAIGTKVGSWDGTPADVTGGPVVSAGNWYHIEAKYDGSANEVEVRVEGTTVLTSSDAGFTGTIEQVRLAIRPTGASSSPAFYVKDFVVWDDNGTYNDDFIGTCLVVSCVPDADVTLNWTPSTGSVGWSILDNSPPTADNILAPTPPPGVYEATMTNLPEDITSIKAVVTWVRAGKSDGGDATLQVGVETAGDTLQGDDRAITTSQAYWRDVFEVSPDTGVPWTPAEVDAASIKLNRTS